MLVPMGSEQLFPARTGHGNSLPLSRPGGRVFREDLLRDFFEHQDRLESLAVQLSALGATSPVTALLLNLVLERAARRAGHHQLLAAEAAQRSLAHELPVGILNELRSIVNDPSDFTAGCTALPADPRTIPTGRLPHKDTTELLQRTCGIGFFEARDRLDAARVLLPHTNADGITHPARYPSLAKHLESGHLDPGDAIRAAKKLERLRPSITRQPEADRLNAVVEAQIVESLLTQGPAATSKLFTTLEHALEDAPAPAPSEQELAAKVGFRLSRRTEHLTYFTLCTTNMEAELVLSLFTQADNPRTHAGNREALADAAARYNNAGTGAGGNFVEDGNGNETTAPGYPVPIRRGQQPLHAKERNEAPVIPEWAIDPNTPAHERPRAEWSHFGRTEAPLREHAGPEDSVHAEPPPGARSAPPGASNPAIDSTDYVPGSDGLTPARRRLQILVNLMRSAGQPRRQGSKGSAGLPQPRMIVYCQLTTLLGLAEKAGITQHGLSVSPGDLRRELCNTGVIPIIFNGESQILDVGREQRFIPDYMRRAILARDGGCLVPGCTVPPEHCEMCHVEGFAEGGATSVFNAGPGCPAHHHAFHTKEYKLVLNDSGLPSVVLPEYLDPEQIPRRNTFWGQESQINPTLF